MEICFSLFETVLRECLTFLVLIANVDPVVMTYFWKVLAKLVIRQFVKRNRISVSRSVENNSDKRF